MRWAAGKHGGTSNNETSTTVPIGVVIGYTDALSKAFSLATVRDGSQRSALERAHGRVPGLQRRLLRIGFDAMGDRGAYE